MSCLKQHIIHLFFRWQDVRRKFAVRRHGVENVVSTDRRWDLTKIPRLTQSIWYTIGIWMFLVWNSCKRWRYLSVGCQIENYLACSFVSSSVWSMWNPSIIHDPLDFNNFIVDTRKNLQNKPVPERAVSPRSFNHLRASISALSNQNATGVTMPLKKEGGLAVEQWQQRPWK